jgi:carbon storage regulator
MLVLSRKVGQRMVIGDNITLVVTSISGNRVIVGIEAPKHVKVIRGELLELPPAEGEKKSA